MTTITRPAVIVVMGPAGAGKTTVGRALASSLGWTFIDADEFHNPEDIDRMRGGVGLTDEERGPWLARVRQAIVELGEKGQSAVIACSALKRSYRDVLAGDDDGATRFVYLRADEELLRERLQMRREHFAGPTLAASQMRDLEAPGDEAITVNASAPPHVLVSEIRQALGL